MYKGVLKRIDLSCAFFIVTVISIVGVPLIGILKFDRAAYFILFVICSGFAGVCLYKLQKKVIRVKGELYYEREKLQAFIMCSTDPVMVLDAGFKIKNFNTAMKNLFGLKDVSAVDRHFMDVIRNEELFGYISYASMNKDCVEPKVISIDMCGSDNYYNVVVRTVKNTIIVLLQNMTPLKELEKEKANLISIVSNEFRTPLTSIMMGISILDNEDIWRLCERQKKVMEAIGEDAEVLYCLVESLVQMLRVELEKPVFHMQLCSVSDIIEECVKNFDFKAHDNNISLICRLENNLPRVNCDLEQIKWVISNLLRNTFGMVNPGEEISINTFAKLNAVCVCIKDTGVGIPPDYYEKMFLKIEDIKDNNQVIHNTGLTAAVAKEIIEAHGGEIWYESKKGFGNTLTFTLPVPCRI